MKTDGMSSAGLEPCRAVLGVWTEKRNAEQICRELGVSRKVLQHWEDRAMEGMMQALETRGGITGGSALTPRLRALLEKRQRGEGMNRLEQKLVRLQDLSKKKTENP